jgi:uncharacterized membrane protein
VVLIALFSVLRTATLRWQAFETNAFDLAFFDQIIFNTAHGRPFETSFVSYNFAGQHFEPILLLFVPAYWLGAGPYFLTVVQAVAAAAAAVPLFFFARRATGEGVLGFAAVVAFLANPYLQRAIAFDFHPEVMAAFPVFLAAWGISSGHRRTAIISALSALLFKEDTVFLVFLLAGVMWSRGWRREPQVCAVVTGVYLAMTVFLVMPLIRGGESSDLVERYGHLVAGAGSGPEALLRDAVLAAARAVQVVLNPEQLWTAALFLVASSAVALLRPAWLLWVAPGLGLALLSSHPQQQHLELHYAAELVPAVIVLAILAAASLPRRRTSLLAVAIIVPPLLAMVALNPLGNGHGAMPSTRHQRAVHAALALVPPGEQVSVSAQSGLLPRLSQRRQAHEFPGHVPKADWIVVDAYGFRSSQSLAAGFFTKLEDVRRSYELVYSEDGVEVFRREP